MPPGPFRPLLPFNKLADEAEPVAPLPVPLPLPPPVTVLVLVPVPFPLVVDAAVPPLVADAVVIDPGPAPDTEVVPSLTLAPAPAPAPAPTPPDKPAGVDEGETEGDANELVSGRFPPSEVEPNRDAADEPDDPAVRLDGRRLDVIGES
jgi:hypothetical protein